MNRVQIKEAAKALLKKNHWLCVGVSFIVTLLGGGISSAPTFSFNFNTTTSVDGPTDIQGLPSFIPDIQEESMPLFILFFLIFFVVALFGGFAINAFVGNQVKVGSCRFFLKHRKNHPVEVGELFKSYSDKTFINVAKVSIIKNLSIFLWSALCVIPGIIKTYEYAAVDYILSVNPSIDYKRALDLSKKIMNGHKMELFELQFSFLGWHLLSLFTCGLLSIFYAIPYQLIAEAEFFAYVRELAIFNGIISYNDIPDYQEYNPIPPMYQNYAPNGGFYNQANMSYAPPQSAEANFTPVEPVATPVTEPVIETTDIAEELMVEAESVEEASVESPAKEIHSEITEPTEPNE